MDQSNYQRLQRVAELSLDDSDELQRFNQMAEKIGAVVEGLKTFGQNLSESLQGDAGTAAQAVTQQIVDQITNVQSKSIGLQSPTACGVPGPALQAHQDAREAMQKAKDAFSQFSPDLVSPFLRKIAKLGGAFTVSGIPFTETALAIYETQQNLKREEAANLVLGIMNDACAVAANKIVQISFEPMQWPAEQTILIPDPTGDSSPTGDGSPLPSGGNPGPVNTTSPEPSGNVSDPRNGNQTASRINMDISTFNHALGAPSFGQDLGTENPPSDLGTTSPNSDKTDKLNPPYTGTRTTDGNPSTTTPSPVPTNSDQSLDPIKAVDWTTTPLLVPNGPTGGILPPPVTNRDDISWRPDYMSTLINQNESTVGFAAGAGVTGLGWVGASVGRLGGLGSGTGAGGTSGFDFDPLGSTGSTGSVAVVADSLGNQPGSATLGTQPGPATLRTGTATTSGTAETTAGGVSKAGGMIAPGGAVGSGKDDKLKRRKYKTLRIRDDPGDQDWGSSEAAGAGSIDSLQPMALPDENDDQW